MAGCLFGIPLSQQHDANGLPMAACLLYVYEANTSTPAVTYQDSGLTPGLELPHPIVADANGRIPMFWVDDSTYRARLTSSAGIVQFDEDNILAIGPSSGGGGGGGVDANALLATGDFLWSPKSGTRAGFVRANGRTIGSATSGAAERANADAEALFLDLWNNYSDTLCAVGGGRGANAAADWAANKTITTLNMRGIGAVGLADMGNSDSGILDNVTFSVGNKTTAASLCGAALHALALSETPAHDHGGTTSSDGAHTHDTTVNAGADQGVGGGIGVSPNSIDTAYTSTSNGAHTHTITSAGSSGAHNNMQPSRVGNWLIKL